MTSPAEKAALFSPRVAFVTGAAQGIGEAIALRLADEGIDIAMLDLTKQESKLEELRSERKEGKR